MPCVFFQDCKWMQEVIVLFVFHQYSKFNISLSSEIIILISNAKPHLQQYSLKKFSLGNGALFQNFAFIFLKNSSPFKKDQHLQN